MTGRDKLLEVVEGITAPVGLLYAPAEGDRVLTDLSDYAHGDAVLKGDARLVTPGLIDGGAALLLDGSGDWADTGVGPVEAEFPASLSPALWFDADDLAAGAVASWPDQSGNGRDAVQATESKQPTCIEGVLNGHNVVRFDNDALKASGFTLNQPNTVFVVGKQTYPQATSQYFIDGVSGRHWLIAIGTITAFQMGAGGTGFNAGVQNADFRYFTALFNGSSSNMRIDGSSVGTGTIDTGALTDFKIGNRFTDDVGLAGDIAAVIVTDGLLSDTDRDATETYLAERYGFQPPSNPALSATEDRSYPILAQRDNDSALHTLLGSSDSVVQVQAASGSNDVTATFNSGGTTVTWADALPALDKALVILKLSGTDATLNVDGVDLATRTVVWAQVAGNMLLGAHGAGDDPWDGLIVPAGTFHGTLTPQEITDLNTAVRSYYASASLTGVGNLSATAKRTRSASASLTGVGNLSATAKRTRSASASLTATGTLSAVAKRIRNVAASLLGVGSLTATAEPTHPARLVISDRAMTNLALSDRATTNLTLEDGPI